MRKILIYFAPLWLFLAFIAWKNVYYAMKVTDINDPRFNPMAYRFEDYAADENAVVLHHLFPIGTPRKEVEALIVYKLGARAHRAVASMEPDPSGKTKYDYCVPYNPFFYRGNTFRMLLAWPFMAGGRNIFVTYDKDDKLIKLTAHVP